MSENLPQTTFPGELISRPYDILPLATYLLAATLFWTWFQKERDPVSLAFLLSCIPECLTQLHVAFGSTQLFDNHFNIAHILKIVAYLSMLAGITRSLIFNTATSSTDSGPRETPPLTHQHIRTSKTERAKRPISLLIPSVTFSLTLIVGTIISISVYLDHIAQIKKKNLQELEHEAEMLESSYQSIFQRSAQDLVSLGKHYAIQAYVQGGITESEPVNRTLEHYLLLNPGVVNIKLVAKRPDSVIGWEVLYTSHKADSKSGEESSDTFLTRDLATLKQSGKLKSGEIYFSDIYLSPDLVELETEKVFSSVSNALFKVLDDTASYVLIATLKPMAIISGLPRYNSNRQFYISDAEGEYLYQESSSDNSSSSHDKNLLRDFPELTQHFQSGTNKLTFTQLKDSTNTKYSAYYKVLKGGATYGSPQLHILLSSSHQQLALALEGTRNKSLLIGLSLALVALTAAILISRRITRPLSRLTETLERYEQTGEIDYLPVNENNEVGIFARSFHKALQNIDASINELNEQKYALDQASIVSITNIRGDITYVNDKFVEVSGYEREELLGQNHRILNSGYHDKAFFGQLYKTAAKGSVWRGEVYNKDKHGQNYWISSTVIAIKDMNGKPQSYVAISSNITGKKAAESELITAKENAEQAAITKSEFLASMSHEIRTPMNGVLGMLGLLLNSKLDTQQRHRAEIAQNSAQSLLTLINDILDFSKIEAGKLDLEHLLFNPRKLIGDLAESLAQQAQLQELELIVDLRGLTLSKAVGDPGRIRQVVTNLVNNAIKFTSQGEVVISARLTELNANLLQLDIDVTDTGIGIPPEKADSLFEAFNQADASTTRQFGGTGLGLSIAKNLCLLMGGTISVKSIPGEGSNFSSSMLLKTSDQAELVKPTIDISQLEILIVDDNTTNLEVLRGQLDLWGAKAIEASSGSEALELCQQRYNDESKRPFDIALLDMQMPEMDGAELGRKLSHDERFQSMKLVMMTSMTYQGGAQEMADIGFDAYFPKPATTSDLFDALSILADDGQALQQAQPLITSESIKTYSTKDSRQIKWPEGTRLLIVEDNHINQMVALSTLKNIGLHADVAGNGLEAISSLIQTTANTPHTLILMDCQMPEMDGYEATRAIRDGKAGQFYTDIPIIAMTANAMQGDKEKCLAAGMNAYLSKPIYNDAPISTLISYVCNNKPEYEDAPMPQDDTSTKPNATASTSEQDTPTHWNPDGLRERIYNNDDLFSALLNSFLSDSPKHSEDILKACNELDLKALKAISHLLKGVCGQLCADKLQSLCAAIEQVSLRPIEQVDKHELEGLHVEFTTELSLLEQSFTEALDQSTASTSDESDETLSNDEFINQLNTLQNKLEQSDYIDPDSLSLLKTAFPDRQEIQNLVIKLVEEINLFDNTAASTTLKEILALIQTS